MSNIIYPRSTRETMCGWMHLPRYIDKIRLYLTGKLHPDYQENLGKGFDERWLKAAGVTHEQMVELVKNSITDGQVADWILRNVKRTDAEMRAHAEGMLDCPRTRPPRRHSELRRFHRRGREAALSCRKNSESVRGKDWPSEFELRRETTVISSLFTGPCESWTKTIASCVSAWMIPEMQSH